MAAEVFISGEAKYVGSIWAKLVQKYMEYMTLLQLGVSDHRINRFIGRNSQSITVDYNQNFYKEI